MSKHIDEDIWSEPLFINTNNWNAGKTFFADTDNNLHLFEKHYIETVDDKNESINSKGYFINSLIYSTRKESIWSVDTILFSPEIGYTNFSLIYDKKDKFYSAFQSNTHEYPTTEKIHFMRKQIEVGIEDNYELLITNYELFQNYPNPFNNQTNITYTLQNISEVEVNIFNTKGEFVQELVSKKMNKGKYSVSFNASKFNSGIYYYRLKIDGVVKETKKMLYLR